MKILFLNSARDTGGGITSALELARGLAGRGHEVTVAAHPRGGIAQRLGGDAAIRVAPIAIRAELNPLRIWQLARLLRALRPDVVLADRRKDVKLAWAALRFSAGAALVHRHGAPSTLRDSTLYRLVWSRLDGLIVNSHAMRQELLAHTPWLAAIPIHVIHNGKDLRRWHPRPESRAAMRAALNLPPNAFIACYHGVLQARKNVDVLLRALAPRPPALGLHGLIIGAGEAQAALEQLARRLAVPARFTGARDDVAELLAAADVAVHLSSAEGFSNAVLEALASGLPVIASDATSHGEQVRDGIEGRLVPLRDEGAVLQALIGLARDADLRSRMARAARARAEREFGLETMSAAYEAALAAAVSRTRAAHPS
jgi:glycosyltransferase involved in cell wall biosynthesis